MISLKVYIREIEQLIDNGLYDDAIAHSIHILSTYPKCIDAYRNLGKSLLEQKKYSEASDVFSRVLSAIPDDFISHVGLSIIFEDQSNLDLAIWHMEQAFDVQPSNLAVQDELKRLFGLRDGEQPTKIRLTRGALVRMYARGELYQQAITEICSILEEDPRRIDLEVILARMHYFSGSIDEAAADCNRILEKIPFCFEANRLLYQINNNKDNTEEASINQSRLISLDPYYQFVSTVFSEEEIPENKVMLEKLDYVPSQINEANLPDWNEDFKTTTETVFKESPNLNKSLLRNVESYSSSVDKSVISNDQETENDEVKNLIPTDDEIPDWLKNVGINSESEFLNNGTLDLSNSTSQASDPIILDDKASDENSTKLSTDDLASLFSEMKEGKMTDNNEPSGGNEEKQFPPSDWMSQFSNSEDSVNSNSSDQAFPDWLKNFQDEEPKSTLDSDDIPDWLKNLQPESEPTSITSDDALIMGQTEGNLSGETPTDNEFLHDDSSDIYAKSSTKEELPQLISEQNDQWEKIDLPIAENEQTTKSTNDSETTIPDASDDTIPDWVKSVLIDHNPTDLTTSIQEPESDTLGISSSEDTNQSTISAQEIAAIDSVSEEGIISQQTNDELLDWLRGLKTEDISSTQIVDSMRSFDSSVNENINTIQEETLIDTPIDNALLINEPMTEEILDQEQIFKDEIEKEHFPFENEVIDDQNINQEQLLSTEVEYTEYANELTETSSELQSLEDIPNEEISDLISKNDFDTLANKVEKLPKQNHSLDSILSTLTTSETKNRENFAYWQCLGDVYSKNNQLSEALLAYQKAEEILLKTISF